VDKNTWEKLAPTFHCSATTRRAMDKWRRQCDSAHQIGLEFIFEEVLIVVQKRWWQGSKMLEFSTWASIWSILQHPEELWTNGADTWIQRIKEV
jgi:hypothetical protein